jgi:RNA polymerase sigma factor (TIGR02999 family)
VSGARDVTQLLVAWRSGDNEALGKLLPIVYSELRRLAQGYLRHEKPGHTLQPTALIHEAYLRLVDQSLPDLQNRSQFFGAAARAMRQILVDYARQKRAVKRDGGRRVGLADYVVAIHGRSEDLLSLDQALTELAKVDERKTKAIELRFFAGLSVENTAEALGVSLATLHRELKLAEAWLCRKLGNERGEGRSGDGPDRGGLSRAGGAD